jgi:hypothetical protein
MTFYKEDGNEHTDNYCHNNRINGRGLWNMARAQNIAWTKLWMRF